jgi:hypothetical protein
MKREIGIFIKLSSIGLIGAVIFQSTPAWAHVKWFSKFSFADKPWTLHQAMDSTFWWLLALSAVCIGLLVALDYKISTAPWTRKLTIWLEGYKGYSTTIMRLGAGSVLLLSFQAGTLFAPELSCSSMIGWVQFILALLLLFNRTVIISGAGFIALYIYGVTQFGWFHMLDYPIFAGAGYYLIVSTMRDEKIKATGLVMLYITVGFSLAWVAIEKLLYPQWGLYLLQQNPHLALGLNLKFFLTSTAFIEISLGYLLMICLLQRSVALVITCVFFLTTLVFGKTEVIGHTIIHASLIVFLIEGAGKVYTAPIDWHKRLMLRVAFACINFILLVFCLLVSYQNLAMAKYEATIKSPLLTRISQNQPH